MAQPRVGGASPVSSGGYTGSESSGNPDSTDLPTFDTDAGRSGGGGTGAQAKKKSWLVPAIAAVVLLAAIGGFAIEHGSSSSQPTPIVATDTSQQVLTLCGADLDQAATTQAIADIKSGAANPLLANLSDQVKQELVSGERSFYKVPLASPQTNASASQDGSSDRIEIDFNGATYGIYNLTKDPVSLDMPLKVGDATDVKCLSVASGKSTVNVDLATVLNPVECRDMAPGDVRHLTVTRSSTGQNYDWFVQEANSGNAVAQYGLGHMYQYGLGVVQDQGQAIHWYQLAAAQNYSDAQAQLAKMNTSQ